MTKSERSAARQRILAAAQAESRKLHEEGGVDIATMDILKIAASFAAEYVVLTCEFGTDESQRSAADTLRDEFLSEVRRFEKFYMGL
jgi:hypothetical protein